MSQTEKERGLLCAALFVAPDGDQGRYGHRAKKPTWLYAVLPAFPELDWTRVWGRPRIGGTGYHSRLERRKAKASSKGVPKFEGISKAERYLTPGPFQALLVHLAASCAGWTPPGRRYRQTLGVAVHG